MYKTEATVLKTIKLYPTYQARFDIRPADASSDIFASVVYEIARSIRERDEKSSNPMHIERPDPDAFDPAEYSFPDNPSIVSDYIEYDGRRYWALTLNELDSGSIEKGYEDRAFTTYYAVCDEEDHIRLAIRTVCREPSTNPGSALSIRPAVVRSIFTDERFRMTEAGVGAREFSSGAYVLNGNSEKETEQFRRDILENPSRNMSLIFIPEDAFENREDTLYNCNAVCGSANGYAHTVLVKKPFDKFSNLPIDNIKRITGELIRKNIVYLTGRSGLSFKVIDTSKLRIDENEKKMKDFKLDFGPGFGGGPSIIMTTPVPNAKTELNKDLADEKKAIRNEIKEISYRSMNSLSIDYDRAKFTDDIKLLRIMSSEDKDAQIRALIEENGKLREEKKELDETVRTTKEENDKLNSKIGELDGNLAKTSGDLEKQKNANSDLKAKCDELQETCKALQDRPVTGGVTDYTDLKPLLDLPVKFTGGTGVVEWIRANYKDTLIVTKRAEDEMKKYDSGDKDWMRFCLMIHYLSGCTKAHRKNGVISKEDPEVQSYDVGQMNLEVTEVGKTSTEHLPEVYSVVHNGRSIPLNLHLKRGNTPGRDLLRIYFNFDDNGMCIIGSMPDHLETLGYS